MTDELNEPKQIKLVTRDGNVVTDYEDEYFSDDDTPLEELPDTQAVIDAANAKIITTTFENVTSQLHDSNTELSQRINEVAEIEARTEAFKSPEGKLDRLARDSQKSGETYEAAYSRVTFAHPELYDAQRDSKKQREQFESIRRKQDRGQL